MAEAGLITILDKFGYSLLVPDAPHVSNGSAQGAGGLDRNDSFGWFEYSDGDLPAHATQKISGLQRSLDSLREIGPVEGVIGFSQGGAMASAVADSLGAKWALLFSPVIIPGHEHSCQCPVLAAVDLDDPIAAKSTHSLVAMLNERRRGSSTSVKLVHHADGHRLPRQTKHAALYGHVEHFIRGSVQPRQGLVD